jgi:ribonuclease VapC
MASAVLDSSALVAYLRAEPGGAKLAGAIQGALLCSVNLAEAILVLLRKGQTFERARVRVQLSQVQIVSFDHALAEATGALMARTRKQGLSLADCACLALAARENLPALTADGAWRDLDVGIEIRFIG